MYFSIFFLFKPALCECPRKTAFRRVPPGNLLFILTELCRGAMNLHHVDYVGVFILADRTWYTTSRSFSTERAQPSIMNCPLVHHEATMCNTQLELYSQLEEKQNKTKPLFPLHENGGAALLRYPTSTYIQSQYL